MIRADIESPSSGIICVVCCINVCKLLQHINSYTGANMTVGSYVQYPILLNHILVTETILPTENMRPHNIVHNL